MQLSINEAWQAGDITEGVIRNVKILGCESRNKNRYPTATREKAVPILENARVNLDHNKKGSASINSRFGKLTNVRNAEDGVYGDLRYLTKHPMAACIVEAAETMPEVLGLSINATGRASTKDKDGYYLVESIDTVSSVDLVSDAATNKSLFEGFDNEQDKQSGEDSSAGDSEEGAASSPEDHVWQGIRNAIMAILDAPGETKERLSHMKALLKSYDKLYGVDPEEQAQELQPEEAEKPIENKPVAEAYDAEKIDAFIAEFKALVEDVQDIKHKQMVKTPKSGLVIEPTATKPDYIRLLRSRN